MVGGGENQFLLLGLRRCKRPAAKNHPIWFKFNDIEGNNHTVMLKKIYELSIASFFTILVFLVKFFGQKLKLTLFITIFLLLVTIITFNFLDAQRFLWSNKTEYYSVQRCPEPYESLRTLRNLKET